MKASKSMNNLEIAELLRDVAAAYELQGGGGVKFKIVAYERAADAVEHLSSEAKDIWDEGKLEDVAGIGKSIAGHLDEIFRTGTSKHFEEIMSDIPPATFELMKVSGIGPKTGYKIAKEFEKEFEGKNALKVLKQLTKDKKISSMQGYTTKTEEAIAQAIDEVQGQKNNRLLLNYAETLAAEIIEWLDADKSILRADPLGSLRRRASTIGDVDITVSAHDTKKALDRFCEYPHASRVLERGDRSASIIIGGGRRVDIIASKPEAYGALLQHFTGSKHHNVALREYALKHNLSLSDYGIYTIDAKGNKKLMEIKTEEEFYHKLGMDYIPPELREGQGEIQAALRQAQGKPGGLPILVENSDVKGDLHIHSNFDIETSHDLGQSEMIEHVTKADTLGYEYIAFSEHNPSHSKHTEKQIVDLLKRKQEVVEKVTMSIKSSKNIKSIKRVFNSLEIDILPDGRLPVSDEGLECLDFALVSLHSSFGGTKDAMTKRVLSALSHPKVKIFAHPTARKLNEREGVELDWDKLFEFCLSNNKFIEINASPSRLDLPDTLVREAVERGVMLTIDTDSHHVDHMDLMPYGVSVARRGWATKDDILNTRSLKEFEKLIFS